MTAFIVVSLIGLRGIAIVTTYNQQFNMSLSSLLNIRTNLNNSENKQLVIPKTNKNKIIEENVVEKAIHTENTEVLIEEVSKYGEILNWDQAKELIPRGSDFKVIDFYTGESFMLRRSVGTNHADVETLTSEDTKRVKKVWGGDFSWDRRPVIVETKGRRIAASLAAMPHAGDENEPGGKTVNWRSLNYSRGTNLDYVKGNNMDGVMDLHFEGSKGHGNPVENVDHQNAVKIAAGLE